MIFFEAKVRDIDRQYEINNNGELDNGVYNKFVNNSARDDEADKGNYERVSLESDYDIDDQIEYKKMIEGLSTGK